MRQLQCLRPCRSVAVVPADGDHTMNLQDALDIVVTRTGHVRFRDLCDPTHPAYDPAWPPWIIEQAQAASASDPVQVVPAAAPAIPLAGDLLEALTRRIG